MDYEIRLFPREREIVVDAGRLGTRRHIIHSLIEVDVTLARELLRVSTTGAGNLSFTAYVVACFARAVAVQPSVQGYRDWRGRLVVFHDVDVVTMIEADPGAVAIPHIVRAANHKTVRDISDEVRSIKLDPDTNRQRGGLIALGPKVPRLARHIFYWALRRKPLWFKRAAGTAVVTSVGMFGGNGGWGVGFLPMHTLGLTVGGIAAKPGVHEGRIAIREYLDLTVSFDHDIVDGAPAARFVNTLRELIETGAVLVDGETGRASGRDRAAD